MLKIVSIIFFILFTLGACTKSDRVLIQKDETDFEAKQQYIVVLKETSSQRLSIQQVKSSFESMGDALNIKAKKVFAKTIHAVVTDLNESELLRLRQNAQVDFIEQDKVISIGSFQTNPIYSLDRLDQESLPLNSEYNYPEGQVPVHAYVLDTGVRITHEEFENRGRQGFDFVDNDSDASDCNGHGTHVAGTLAGKTFGGAKSAIVHGVRVLSCQGFGRFSDIIAGIEWVSENHEKPAVANMSLRSPVSLAIDRATEASINQGITYVVAAGNDSENACNSSPARVSSAITVGSSNRQDRVSFFSNVGPCVDIFAPGSDILSAWFRSDTDQQMISGTSMASPLVASVAAMYLSQNPSATPQEVKNAIVENAVSNQLSGLRSYSPDRLVSSLFLLNNDEVKDPVEKEPEDSELVNGDLIEELNDKLGNETRYYVDVPEGTSVLNIAVADGEGDVDLYLRQGVEPSRFNYDCRPYRFGNNEVCEVKKPNPGRYHILLRAYSNYSGVSLSVEME